MNFSLVLQVFLLLVGHAISFEFPFECFLTEDQCPNENITFWLYTDELDEPYELSTELESSIEKAPFKIGTNLVVIVHGYTGDRDYAPNPQLRPEYTGVGYNVISVDYGKLAQPPCYLTAAFNIETVGKCLSGLLHLLFTLRSDALAPNTTHLVGFSLGAHTVGIAGAYYESIAHKKLPRITGLDPALPLFDNLFTVNSSLHLDEGDAEFVDVIHTNAGTKGKLYPVGHADFFINNAAEQPQCMQNSSCNHVRAVEIYAESITSSVGFWGIKCELHAAGFLSGVFPEACSWPGMVTGVEEEAEMGENCNPSTRGTYMVTTNDFPPYAKGHLDLENRIDLGSNLLPIHFSDSSTVN